MQICDVVFAIAALLAIAGFVLLGRRHAALRDSYAELEDTARMLESTARTDPLTGIYNRRFLSDRISRLIDAYASSGGEGAAFALAMVDIDFFKRINDTFGHLSGDRVLIKISRVIGEQLSGDDIFGRYGGEEFLIIFEGQALSQAVEKLEKVNRALECTDWGISATVTVSAGAAAYDGCTYAQLLTRVDENLYAAKDAGRNRIATARGKAAGLAVREALEERS